MTLTDEQKTYILANWEGYIDQVTGELNLTGLEEDCCDEFGIEYEPDYEFAHVLFDFMDLYLASRGSSILGYIGLDN